MSNVQTHSKLVNENVVLEQNQRAFNPGDLFVRVHTHAPHTRTHTEINAYTQKYVLAIYTHSKSTVLKILISSNAYAQSFRF